MAQYQDHAMILRSRPYREADSLLTLFCLHAGKVSAIARGARRPKSTVAAGLYPLTHSVVTLYRGRSTLETVSAAEMVEGFPRLRDDLDRTAWGMALAGLVDELFSEHDAEPAAFQSLRHAFEALSSARRCYAVGLPMAWRFLEIAGLKPDWGHCGRCAEVLPGTGVIGWNPESGAVFCPRCGGAAETPLRRSALETIREWERRPPDRVAGVVADKETEWELERMLSTFLLAHLGRLPRAWEFLNSVGTLARQPGSRDGSGQDWNSKYP